MSRYRAARCVLSLVAAGVVHVGCCCALAQAPNCGPYGGGYGPYGKGVYGEGVMGPMAPGEPFAPSPLELAEAAPAQAGENFALADSGYIDDARIRNLFRFRFDAAYDSDFPDRAEFIYAQCGCVPGGPGPGTMGGPDNIPPGTAATSIDFQEFWAYLELAASDRFSAFIDVPFRIVDFDLARRAALSPQNPGGALPIDGSGGLSDIIFGVKYAFIADPDRFDTFQFKVYTPTGDADRGLGTNHISLEPAYLAYRQFGDRFRMNGELRLWIPISDSEFNGQNFAGPVFRYGIGGAYDIYQSCDCCNRALSAVVEFVGWTVLDGLKSNPLTGVLDATGDTIVNVKVGGRWRWGGQSIYAGYGRALTDEVWYTDIARVEYTFAF